MRTRLLTAFLLAVAPFVAHSQSSGGVPALREDLAAEVAARMTADAVEAAARASADTAASAAVAGEASRASAAEAQLQAANALLQGQVATLQATLDTLQQAVAALQATVSTLQAGNQLATALSPYLTVEAGDLNGVKGPHVIFTGVNVHVRSGDAPTHGAADGHGNLILGWNETSTVYPVTADGRWGSNNLVVGPWHEFKGKAGFVAGMGNRISSLASSVSGGYLNIASGDWASVSGGYYGTASGPLSSVSGGNHNTASGDLASASGGESNIASGIGASVSGGLFCTASGQYASVSGGYLNSASGNLSSVSGGVTQYVPQDWGYAPYP
jgi:hypothetical protein